MCDEILNDPEGSTKRGVRSPPPPVQQSYQSWPEHSRPQADNTYTNPVPVCERFGMPNVNYPIIHEVNAISRKYKDLGNALHLSLKRKKEKFREYEQIINQLREDINQLKVQNDILINTRKELEGQNEFLINKVEEVERKAEEDVRQAKSDEAFYKNRYTEVHQKHENFQIESTQKIDLLEKTKSESENRNSTLVEIDKANIRAMQKLLTENDSLKLNAENQRKIISEKSDQISRISNELEKEKNHNKCEMEKKNRKMLDLEDKVKSLEKEKNYNKDELEKKNSKILDLESEVKSLEKNRDLYRAIVGNVRSLVLVYPEKKEREEEGTSSKAISDHHENSRKTMRNEGEQLINLDVIPIKTANTKKRKSPTKKRSAGKKPYDDDIKSSTNQGGRSRSSRRKLGLPQKTNYSEKETPTPAVAVVEKCRKPKVSRQQQHHEKAVSFPTLADIIVKRNNNCK